MERAQNMEVQGVIHSAWLYTLGWRASCLNKDKGLIVLGEPAESILALIIFWAVEILTLNSAYRLPMGNGGHVRETKT